ncbi:hypothetical protein ACNHFS_002994 [Yersinia enterocolitica]|uniref:hypothetical protein n=1 Tax=Yersinia enterocolitica TaxID=630 RepID=UPI0037078F71
MPAYDQISVDIRFILNAGCVASTEQEGKPALLHLRLARNITAFAVPSSSRWPYRASASRFLLQRAFRRRPWRLTRAIVFVGNIPDCAQHQNHDF